LDEGYQSPWEIFKRSYGRRTLPEKFTPIACRTIDTFQKVWFGSSPEIGGNEVDEPTKTGDRKDQFVARIMCLGIFVRLRSFVLTRFRVVDLQGVLGVFA
jgi:hypothetical protein